MKNSTVLDIKQHLVPHEKQGIYDNFADLIRVNYRSRLPDDHPDQVLKDIARLADSERGGRGDRTFLGTLKQAVEASISLQKDEGKVKPILNAALVNKCLTRLLGADNSRIAFT